MSPEEYTPHTSLFDIFSDAIVMRERYLHIAAPLHLLYGQFIIICKI